MKSDQPSTSRRETDAMKHTISTHGAESGGKSRCPNAVKARLAWGAILLAIMIVAPEAARAVPYPNCKSYQTPHLVNVQHYSDLPSSQCEDASGWYGWCYELELTQGARDITIMLDGRTGCPGHFWEVWINDQIIGTTQEINGRWGGYPFNTCNYRLGGGTFTARLGCSGTYVIRFRDKGLDGHSYSDIRQYGMCPPRIRFEWNLTIPTGPSPNAWEKDPVVSASAAGEGGGSGSKLSSTELATFASSLQTASDSTESCPRTIDELLDQVDPFITVDPVTKIAQLDRAGAVASGVSPEAVDLAGRWVELQNRVVRDGVFTTVPGFTQELARRFPQLAPSGTRSQCGWFSNPTECEPWIPSNYYASTLQGVVDELVRRGFHNSYYPNPSPVYDYSKNRDYPGCPYPGAFRIHARIRQCGFCWTFLTQGDAPYKPEPNPELGWYAWPYKLWGLYVYWWHQDYCNNGAPPCP